MKNDYSVDGEIVRIFVNRKNGERLETIISKADLQKAMSYQDTWVSIKCNRTGKLYIVGTMKRNQTKRISLHRLIIGARDGFVVDHINHDTLDNRTENLREVTVSQNTQNKDGIAKHNKSGFRNIHWRKDIKKWQVVIGSKGKKISLGCFNEKEDAINVAKRARQDMMEFSTE